MNLRDLTIPFVAFSSLAALAALASGCGDDEGTSSSAATSSSSSASSTSGGDTGGGGAGGAGNEGGAGGAGGGGGAGGNLADVDPIEGVMKGDVELVADNFQFTEGPIWIASEGVLLFSDIPANTIHKLTPPSAISVFRMPSDNSNGLGLDQNGLLVAAEHGARRVSRTLGNGTVETVASEYMSKKLNSPNDVIVRSDGNLYFTDPPYGLNNPNDSELGFFGVFRVAPGGAVSLVAMDMQRPNGIGLSPDGSKLYVADTQTSEVRVFPVSADGATGAGSKLMSTSQSPDGLAIDDAGNLYVTTSAGVEVFRPDGSKWGTVEVPQQPANCGFGGADRKTLYITARTGLYKVTLNIPGIP
jgi:gluconolactonase